MTRARELAGNMKNIFVGNLDFNISEDELRHLFQQHGTVQTVTLVKNRDTDSSRGFAFVEMASDSEAANAIKALNGTLLGGRPLDINEARPKQDGDDRSNALERRKRPREPLRTRKHRQHRY